MEYNEFNRKYLELPAKFRRSLEKRNCKVGGYFFELIRKNRVENAIEIGTFKGKNAVFMAAACAGTVYTINIRRDEIEIAEELARNLSINNIEFIQGDSLEVLPDLVKRVYYQFVFIDGFHDYRHSRKEFVITSGGINTMNGCIVFDDVDAVHADAKGDGGVVKTVKEIGAEIITVRTDGGRLQKLGVKKYGAFQM